MNPIKAFRTQYLTVMLIVISVLVSSYVRRSTDHQDLLKAAQMPGKPRPVPLDTFTLDDVFSSETQLNNERVDALAQVLKSHDLVAEIAVNSGASTIENTFEVAVGRALSLMKGLTARGIGMETVHVYARATGISDNGAEVRLYAAP